MRQSKGGLAIASEGGKHITVTVYLPATNHEVGARCASAPERRDVASGVCESVLLVEDQPDIAALAEAILSGSEYRVTTVAKADAALAVLKAGSGFDLLFSDLIMPGAMNGVMLARAARQRFPDLRVLLATGSAAEVVERNGTVAGAFAILAKRDRRAELLARVREVLDAPASGSAR